MTTPIQTEASCAIALLLLTLAIPAVPAADYAIQKIDALAINFVMGDTTQIKVTAPSPALLRSAAVKLNGQNITSALHPDDSGALAGTVGKLQPGDNLLQVFAKSTSKKVVAQLKVNRGITPKVDCASMKDRKIPAEQIVLPTGGAIITGATLNSGAAPPDRPAAFVPEYCDITGSIAPADPKAPNINFRVTIPTSWNQKSWHMGGGGTNGMIPNNATSRATSVPPNSPNMTAQGYALYGSDSGHQMSMSPGRGRGFDPAAMAAASDWVVNQEAWMNFAYEQLKKTHDAAMQVMNLMYGTKAKVSYFAGASQGGREALEVVSRYPNDYDGILSQVPLAYFAGLLIDPTVKGVSQLAQGTWVPPAKAAAIRNEILRQCDSLDGAEDGVISDYAACNNRMDPTVTPNPLANIRCAGGADTGNNCLSDLQLATIDSIHAPVKFGYPLANGESDWPGWGTGLEASMWLLSGTQPDAANPNAFNAGIGAAVQKGRLGFSQSFNLLTLDLTAYRSQIQALSDQLDVREDWSGFLKKGGKLIMVTAASDSISNPRAQMRLYEKVVARHGQAAIDKSVSYFVMPNANHGLSGSSANGTPLPSTWDGQVYLRNWVENGVEPPDPIVLTRNDNKAPYSVLSSRPMCRFPKYPRYKGAGDPNLADSYTCTAP
jgi:hypothetical protein